jgi:hypothetical protein
MPVQGVRMRIQAWRSKHFPAIGRLTLPELPPIFADSKTPKETGGWRFPSDRVSGPATRRPRGSTSLGELYSRVRAPTRQPVPEEPLPGERFLIWSALPNFRHGHCTIPNRPRGEREDGKEERAQ